MNTSPSPSAATGVDERLTFMQLDADACARIRSLKDKIERELPRALEHAYDQIRRTPAVSKFFASEAHIAGASRAQMGHWEAIGAAQFDARYFASVQAVGRTHARIGLEPRWYIDTYSIIASHLVSSIVADLWPKGLMFKTRRAEEGRRAGEAVGALIRAIMLDMDLAISVYVQAAEEARLKGEAEVLEKERQSVAGFIGVALGKLAEKDLTYRMSAVLPDAYRQLQEDFNAAAEQLSAAFESVIASVTAVSAGTREIASASNDLSRRTEQQASSLEQTAAALSEITSTVARTAEGAKTAREVVNTARSQAKEGGDVVASAIAAMETIEKSSQRISQIIGVIDEIAFQTNLLALNAGVEAARAGDAGRGFAVVASEVRALAQRSSDAAKEIRGLISSSTAQVEEGVSLVTETGRALSQIGIKVSEINDVVAAIAASAQEQASSLQEVNTAVAHMDQVTQQNAAMSEQATAASQSLAQETEQLSQLVEQFQLARDGSEDLRRELRRAAPHAFERPAGADKGARRRPVRVATASGGARLGAREMVEDDWKEF